MTNKEFLTNVSLNNITAETIAYATEALRKADEATAARSAAKNAEDAPMIETIVNTLTQNARVYTAKELADLLGVHQSKATALCKKVPNIRVSDVQVDRRVVKGYSL